MYFYVFLYVALSAKSSFQTKTAMSECSGALFKPSTFSRSSAGVKLGDSARTVMVRPKPRGSGRTTASRRPPKAERRGEKLGSKLEGSPLAVPRTIPGLGNDFEKHSIYIYVCERIYESHESFESGS